MQMFIWNNIFFSLGFDVKDHYKDFGGDAAAYAAPVSSSHLIVYQCSSLDLRELTKSFCFDNRLYLRQNMFEIRIYYFLCVEVKFPQYLLINQ